MRPMRMPAVRVAAAAVRVHVRVLAPVLVLALALALALALWAVPARSAGPDGIVDVDISNLTPGIGRVLVGVCTAREFLTPACTATALAPARDDPQRVRLTRVPPGEYAVQVVYDRNANHVMDVDARGVPTEPTGFSRGAVGRRGPPRFDDAKFRFDGDAVVIPVRVY